MAEKRLQRNHTAEFQQFIRKYPDFRIGLTRHARDRMKQHGVQLPQIRTVLERGSVLLVEADINTGLDKYRVVGRDSDGRNLGVVINLDETGQGRVTVVTTIISEHPNSSGRRRERK